MLSEYLPFSISVLLKGKGERRVSRKSQAQLKCFTERAEILAGLLKDSVLLVYHLLIILECLDYFKAYLTEQEIAASKLLCHCQCHRSWWPGRGQKIKSAAPWRARLEGEFSNSWTRPEGRWAQGHPWATQHRAGTCLTQLGPIRLARSWGNPMPGWESVCASEQTLALCHHQHRSSVPGETGALDKPTLSSRETSPGWTWQYLRHGRNKAKQTSCPPLFYAKQSIKSLKNVDCQYHFFSQLQTVINVTHRTQCEQIAWATDLRRWL